MFLESELPYGWQLLSKNESSAMESELARETSKNHLLYKKSTIAIAKNNAEDSVLFSLVKLEGYLVVVHLTWKYEMLGFHPLFEVFESRDFFLSEYET